jgi:hypothetical protein
MCEYSGFKLSKVPFDKINIGMEVKSLLGNPGKVSEKRSPGHRGEDNDIVINWDNGKVSDAWHFWMDNITVK